MGIGGRGGGEFLFFFFFFAIVYHSLIHPYDRRFSGSVLSLRGLFFFFVISVLLILIMVPQIQPCKSSPENRKRVTVFYGYVDRKGRFFFSLLTFVL